jgi:signal transduction histidine kinase
MLAGTERLSRLVDQLLELSQFESGAIRIDPHEFKVGEAVECAAADVRPVRVGVRIVAEISDGLTGMGDPERIHEVLTNLLSNAVRHSPPGGQVTVRGAPVPGGVRIEVSDEGPGVPPEHLDQIFERFYRVDAARESRAGGAGLGLAIARSIVELHGGSIRAEPAARSSGCRITLDLPG